MSTIIKAQDRPAAQRGVAFNFDDMSQQAGKYLDTIRAQAQKIVADAHQEAIAIRQKAEADGKKAAMLAAEKGIDLKVSTQLETLLPALRAAIEGVQQARRDCLGHWERSAIHVAAAIAGRVIRKELSHSPEIPLTLIKEALEMAAGSSQPKIHLNPADCAALGNQVQALLAEFSRLGPAELISDPLITQGGCRVETRHGVIDQQFEAQLARIEEELNA
jgi:flagellar biosynthesis/type III secretory pathway protein FliH